MVRPDTVANDAWSKHFRRRQQRWLRSSIHEMFADASERSNSLVCLDGGGRVWMMVLFEVALLGVYGTRAYSGITLTESFKITRW